MTASGRTGSLLGSWPVLPAPGVPAPGTAELRWPRAAVLGLLGVLALGLVLVAVRWPEASGWAGPAVLAAASSCTAVLLLRHARSLDRPASGSWRTVALVVGLLAAGQTVAAVSGAGVNPTSAGPQDVPMLLAVPVALLGCARLVRSAAGRISSRVVLDAAVALVALAALLEVVSEQVLADTGGLPADLVTLLYPGASVLLCVVGLVTFAGVSESRRRAAGWLLASFSCLTLLNGTGALAAVRPSVGFDLLTEIAWLGMLAAGTLALAADPGRSRTAEQDASTVPLLGVVISYCAAFGVVLLLLVGRVLGRTILPVEAVAACLLLVLVLVRSLMWAADGARLTRRVLRTEAYFRTLVHGAADITIVLDHDGRITWDSGAGSHPHGWTARELEGRPLADFVHDEDRAELDAVLAAGADPDQGRGRVFRLRSRDGRWPAYETVRVVPSGPLPALPEEPAGAGCGAGLVLHLRDVDDRRQNELELERMAYTDYLTGLPNRARLMAALDSARARTTEGDSACLLLLDLDGFKAVNDIAGHDAGDLLLGAVADRLRATVRDRDLVGRLGGDEFAVVVRAGLAESTALAERILVELTGVHRAVPTPGTDPDLVFDVSCSIGVTELHPADDVPVTFRNADLALRAAKAAGKGCVRRHGETADAATVRRTRLARDLPDALSRGELRLLYQPVVGVAERRVLGLEALVRWDHPALGEVAPDEFIPLAEDDGLIVPLQRWVLERATAELAVLLEQGRDLQLGVNISARHLQSGSLVPDVSAALARAGVPARRLMLEVTESLFISEPDRGGGDLQTLHDLGCVISLDDFGRGYSTFAYLARLPVDVLKMDREFLAGIEDDERSAALVLSVIELGRRLAIDVVAEGVETPGQLAALRALGCRYLQGFLLGRPTAPADLPAVIDALDADLLDAAVPLTVGTLGATVPVGE
ncbi:Diguanylate cyclase/phosphodiesterase with PAS/PAC sensor(S) [Modestobacter italicus]|uniref:Diguanylate cyclase/phosphodiesterase with PAS/PAC sensor(S) n=1 Tax=Modestobacter italicus (strain DSM 44449 / CECT 9708 / BC 501) TaxID=2732864 RepID=I4F2K1_MODI5|nr:bifunctional diguanylate cyclase/phosphodiesterase [Modestobacter marinus]CCH89864.1 Diguanylate cyclase/phosphodiesterase with PAS/PAC sensor(S) [Modestobacter marinus]